MQTLPNLNAAFVNPNGTIKSPWNSYLQQFTQAPSNVIDETVGASPFTFVAKEPGNLVVSSGTIISVLFQRGSVIIDLTGEKIIPVSISDTVTVAYSVLPLLRFIPLYGATPR